MNLSAMIWNPDPPVPWFGQFYAPPSDYTHSFMKYSITQTLYIAALKNL